MKKWIFALFIIVLGIGIGFLILFYDNSSELNNYLNNSLNNPIQGQVQVASASSQQTQSTSGSAGINKITLSELKRHNLQSDCWVVFRGSVYDLTAFLPRHAGGKSAISPYCGTADFEGAFAGQHSNSMVSLFYKVSILKGEFTSE